MYIFYNVILFIISIELTMFRELTLLVLGAAMVLAQRRLALPDPRSCANRKSAVFPTTLILFYN